MPFFGPAASDAVWSATFNFNKGGGATKPPQNHKSEVVGGQLPLELCDFVLQSIDFAGALQKETTQRAMSFDFAETAPVALGRIRSTAQSCAMVRSQC